MTDSCLGLKDTLPEAGHYIEFELSLSILVPDSDHSRLRFTPFRQTEYEKGAENEQVKYRYDCIFHYKFPH